MRKLVDIIAGARPNFMKIAPIIRRLEEHQSNGSNIEFRLIHTGQHYDHIMSGAFFEELGIPIPHVNFAVGSGSQAEQTAGIMIEYERLLETRKSWLTLVVGDVTSTLACAIVAQKAGVRVAHVEAGIRSRDWGMPEEINRVVTDSVSNYFFTTSRSACDNLLKEGVASSKVYLVGNTMIDTLISNLEKLTPPSFFAEKRLDVDNYVVLTMHRPSNVDSPAKAMKILETISNNAGALPIIFPAHPRTIKMLGGRHCGLQNIITVPPLGYHEFNWLVKNSKAVITDSGGVSEETTFLGIPCITLRENTERPETVELGTNLLVGDDLEKLKLAINNVLTSNWKSGTIPEKWDGQAGRRIADILNELAQGAQNLDHQMILGHDE